MQIPGLRSPSAKVRDIVYFGRMLDKIRLHATGELPADYQPNLGKGFDEFCVNFLGVNYNELVERMKQGGNDEDLLEWCFSHGHHPSAQQIFVWNEFMRKRGWNDDITQTLARRKRETAMSDRDEIQTMFAFIDADEGRALSTGQLQPPL
jgi:Domain of unknown function (DUF5069)